MLELILGWILKDCLFFLGYVASRSSFPQPLSKKEEAECLAKMQTGDEAARHKLIEHNLRLVVHISRKYQIPSYTQDDLISIGALGLIKAVSSYKPDSGTALATYAARCIENEILMALRASKKRQSDISLSHPLGTDVEGNDISFTDILGTDPDAVEEEVVRRVTLSQVRQVLHSLPKRERVVLELRYGLLDGKSHPQHEIAKLLNISRSYVSRVEKQAVELLKDALSSIGNDL